MIRNGYNPVFAEQGSAGILEMPDVIGWRGGSSTIFEIKVTLEDFKRDSKKIFRQTPECGLGNYRYYIIPEELKASIYPILSDGWGLKYFGKHGICNVKESECFIKYEAGEIMFLISRIKEIQRFGKCTY